VGASGIIVNNAELIGRFRTTETLASNGKEVRLSSKNSKGRRS